MKKHAGWILALCLCVLLGLAPRTQAAEPTGTFSFTVMTANQTVVAPVSVPYTAEQTVLEAIQAAGYVVEITEEGTIASINGTAASFLRYYDGGGYDMEAPASGITAMMFCVNDVYSEAMLELICTMCRYSEATNHVQNDPDARAAYEKALVDMRAADADTARSLCDALSGAMQRYADRMNGAKYSVAFQVTQAGAPVSNPAVRLTDAYGNVTEGSGAVQVVAGEYTYVVTDGGVNRTEGTLTVSGSTSVTTVLPSGQWFGEVSVLDGDNVDADGGKTAFASQQSANHVTWYVDDTADVSSLYLYAVQGAVPDASTRLYAMYTDNLGIDRSGSYRTWESANVQLPGLVTAGMEGRSFTLEARYTKDGVTQIQTMTVEVVRVPTLQTLTLSQSDSPLYLPFRPGVTDYTLRATASAVTVDARAFTQEGTTVTINGGTSSTVPLSAGKNSVTIQVTHTSGQSRTYRLTIEKLAPATVQLAVPDGVAAQLQNLDGIVLEPQGGSYRLIPGDTYVCVTTKNTWYHASQEFTAADGLTISAPVPQTSDFLANLVFYNKSAVSSREAFAMDQPFSAANHAYTMPILDTTSAIYVQATPAQADLTVTANYVTQSLTAAKCGVDSSIKVTYPVDGTGAVHYLNACLAQSGYTQTITMQVQRDMGNGLVQYQQYIITLPRKLHLQTLTGTVDGEKLDWLNANGAIVQFNRTVTDYYAQVLTTAQTLNLAGEFPNADASNPIGGGYYALVDGVRYDSLEDVAIDLTGNDKTRDIAIRIFHGDEQSVSQTYTLHVKKVEPVQVTFRVTPEDAVVFVTDNKNGAPVYAVDGAFPLIPGNSYTYNVTAAGYIGRANSRYTGPGKNTSVTVALTAAPANNTLKELEAEWPSFRPGADNNGVIDAASPVAAEDAVLYWATKVGLGWYGDACGCPILVDDHIYIYAGEKIFKIDKTNGQVVAQGDMDHSSNFSITNAAYGGGMIFVGLSDGSVQAFNADTLESVWIYRDALGGQPNCPITYYNGYVYTGFWKSETIDANFVCLSATDEDPTQTMEEKIASWTYTAPGGFYWSGACVNDDFVLVGTDDGQAGNQTGHATLACLDTRTGAVLSTLQLPHTGDVRCSITYDAASDSYYFTTKGGYFYGVQVGEGGILDAAGLRSICLGNGSSSTPTIYNGRAYVGVSGTGAYSPYAGHTVTVLDLKNWEIAYRVPTQGNPQTSGVLTTAYDQGDGTVYVYFLDNYTPGKLRVICDRPGQSQPVELITETYKDTAYSVAPVLFTPYNEQTQYAICSPVVDSDGTIYFKNDSGYLMAVGSPAVSLELTAAPAKLSYKTGETFDATGLQVTAAYANGTTRDVTSAMVWNEEPLTAQDTTFELILPMLYQDRDGQAGQKVDSLVLTLELDIETVAQPMENPYTDVAEGTWYYDAVMYAYENGLMNGMSATTFVPNGTTTRAMAVTLLYRMEGKPQVHSANRFTDVESGRYFTDAVIWAAENGIVKGMTADTFQPNGDVTREQMATFLYRYAQYKGYATSARTDVSAYPDAASVSSYAEDPISWAVATGVISGNKINGTVLLDPKGNATRAQIATVLMRYAKNIVK